MRRPLLLIAFAGTLLGATPSFAKWPFWPSSDCQKILSPPQEAKQIVESMDDIPGQDIVFGDKFITGYGMHLVRSFDVSNWRTSLLEGNHIADIGYTMPTQTKMHVEITRVESAFQGRKYLKWLLAKALLREPQVTQISGDLQWENFEAFAKTYFAFSKSDRFWHRKRCILEAIKSTPAYKARAAVGFTKITSYSADFDKSAYSTEGAVYFTVEREAVAGPSQP